MQRRGMKVEAPYVVRDENGFAVMDRSKRHHQTGIFAAPSDNMMNHYHTRYSTSHQFKDTRGINETTRLDLLSGFGQNHHHSATGLNLPAEKEITDYTSTYTEGYEGSQLFNKKADLPFTYAHPTRFEGGFIRNNGNVHPDLRELGSDTSYGSSFQNTARVAYEDYDVNSKFATVTPAPSGFVTNHRAQGTFNLDRHAADEWMQTTNVAQQRASHACPSSQEQSLDNFIPNEYSGYNRSILEPPATGVGSEDTKLRGPLLANTKGHTGKPFELVNDMPITQEQELRILEKMRKEEPLKYQHALDGQQIWQTTYNLSHQKNTQDMLNKGHDVRNGVVGAATRQPGDKYMKDMQGFYSTTTKRNQIFEATRQAYAVNEPQSINFRSSMSSGFTQNIKDPMAQQPWLNDMRAGVDVFGRGVRTSNQIIGLTPETTAVAGGPVNVPAVQGATSAYARECNKDTVIPTSGIPGKNSHMDATYVPQAQYLHATVRDMKNYNRAPVPKSYGEGVVF